MSELKRPLKVFLCHASVDKPKVRELSKRLLKNPLVGDDLNLTNGQNLPVGLRENAKQWGCLPWLG